MLVRSAIFAISLALGSGAIAEPNGHGTPVPSELITYSDQDLNSPSSRAALRHRIEAAASRVCDDGGMQVMEDFVVYSRCYTAARWDGLRQLDRLVASHGTGAAVAASAVIITRK